MSLWFYNNEQWYILPVLFIATHTQTMNNWAKPCLKVVFQPCKLGNFRTTKIGSGFLVGKITHNNVWKVVEWCIDVENELYSDLEKNFCKLISLSCNAIMVIYIFILFMQKCSWLKFYLPHTLPTGICSGWVFISLRHTFVAFTQKYIPHQNECECDGKCVVDVYDTQCIDNNSDNFMKSVLWTGKHVDVYILYSKMYVVFAVYVVLLPKANVCFTCISHDNNKIQEMAMKHSHGY